MKGYVCMLLFVTSVIGHYDNSSLNIRKLGSWVTPSRGQPWPKPQLMANIGDGFMVLRPALFKFKIVRHTCDILEEALKRYYSIILHSNALNVAPGQPPYSRKTNHNKTWKASKEFDGYLDVLQIDLLTPCEKFPHDSMEEAYELKIDSPDFFGEALLASSSNWGILRGLETFSQLLHPTDDYTALQVRNVIIADYPRFSFRSILLDTSRHFLSKKVIYQNLDLMAMNKYNVFHWHLVDDQSFPYQSKSFPALSDRGAYHPYTHVYTQEDVADIIEYARLRGIRVVPEFDTPGHTESWGPGQPELLTSCYNLTTGQPNGKFGPIDPTRPKNFDFLRIFFEEISNVFPEKYLHMGGDEVEHECWESNPKITAFMEDMNFTSYSDLEGYFMQNLVDIIQSFPKNNSYLVWQEVFDRGVRLDNSTIVNVWKGENLQEELYNVTLAGYKTLVYSCWYLNYISYGIDWQKYYSCDPHNFTGTALQKKLVFGGGAAIWGEYVDSTNIIPRLWPRAAVPAERLWSSETVTDTKNAASRLEEHRCRLLKRGYQVQPANGPGYCLIAWD